MEQKHYSTMSRVSASITGIGFVMAVSLAGCGGAANAVIKQQVSNQCASTGLKGCPDIADGLIAYNEGHKAEAEVKLRKAAGANSPAQVQQFAKVLRPIIEAADPETAKTMREVLAILANDPSSAPLSPDEPEPVAKASTPVARVSNAKKSSAPESPAASAAPELEMDNLRAGSVNPGTDEQGLPCEVGAPDGRKCQRVRVLLGPFVLTNVYTAGGCADDLFVMDAPPGGKPRWTMLATANNHMNVTGRFAINEGEGLYVGRLVTTSKDDLRCAVVWSGYRPHNARPAYGNIGE